MRSLGGALAASGTTGQPLPAVFRAFVENDIEIRRGQLTLIASGPGAGKSIVALSIAVRTGVPTLMISPDSDAFTSATRAAAMLTGDPLGHVESAMRMGYDEQYLSFLRTLDNMRWEFEQAPSLAEISDATTAFGHLYGEYPHLIVVDNLGNVYGDSDDDNVSLKHSVEQLKVLAAESSAAVIALHHLTGEYDSSDRPAPLAALIGKVSKPAAVVLTLFRGKYDDIGVCIVKNRFGKADPRGYLRAYLDTDLERMKVG